MRITRLDKGFKLSGTRREAIALMLIPLLFPPLYIGTIFFVMPTELMNVVFNTVFTVLGYLIGVLVLGMLSATDEE